MVRLSFFTFGIAIVSLLESQAIALPQEDSVPQLTTEVAFPNLRFIRPVELTYPEDQSDLLFVVEQHRAKILSFRNDPETSDAETFLDLPTVIGRDNEEGLLGLAFHPDYAENGYFYVYYSARNPRRSVVSRFEVMPNNPRKANPRSEYVIWESADDPFGNHNGGCIKFGPDGYLYISLGDGGAANDPLKTGQNPSDFFGSILRIDVDQTVANRRYGIPADNPALRDPKFRNWAPEVYAIGLRNVWKFSFDRETGDLWAGDVGQNKWEEIVVVVNGGNYGWNYYEGFHPFQIRGNRVNRSSPALPPIVEYPHPDVSARQRKGRNDVGKSVTGGFVYRGTRLPELEGYYVYGDYETGRIWGLRLDENGDLAINGELIDLDSNSQPKINVASFAEDRAGELYILGFDGRIYQFLPRG